MLTRMFDIAVAALGLLVSAPLVAVGAIGIKLSSPGPAFYHAQRMGRFEKPFRMHKLRTMHVRTSGGAQITGPNDPRIFAFGNFLRLTKIDELPQLWNVLVGDMSIVGPRPESVDIVRDHYSDWMKETLRVRPGITSPGAIFGYEYGDILLDDADPEGSYVHHMLEPKLAIERAYVERANILRNLGVIVRTGLAILRQIAGASSPHLPAEAHLAGNWYRFDSVIGRESADS